MKNTLLALAAAALAACATSPLGRNQLILVPDSQMNQMGVDAFQQLKEKQTVSRDRGDNRYVSCVAEAIIEQLPEPWSSQAWEVAVFEDDSANAFALPGGKIGVHTGLLDVAKNQDQLATVMGHEVAHVLARHGAERVSQQVLAQTGLQAAEVYSSSKISDEKKQQWLMLGVGLGAQLGILLPYSRTHESEADLYGLDLMARAGFNPDQSVDLWQNMDRASAGKRPPTFLSTHPDPKKRIENLRQRLPHAQNIAREAHAAGRRPNCRQ